LWGLLLDVHFRARLFLVGDGFRLLPHIPVAFTSTRVALRFGLMVGGSCRLFLRKTFRASSSGIRFRLFIVFCQPGQAELMPFRAAKFVGLFHLGQVLTGEICQETVEEFPIDRRIEVQRDPCGGTWICGAGCLSGRRTS
jgi:hypothetical protein